MFMMIIKYSTGRKCPSYADQFIDMKWMHYPNEVQSYLDFLHCSFADDGGGDVVEHSREVSSCRESAVVACSLVLFVCSISICSTLLSLLVWRICSTARGDHWSVLNAEENCELRASTRVNQHVEGWEFSSDFAEGNGWRAAARKRLAAPDPFERRDADCNAVSDIIVGDNEARHPMSGDRY